MLTRDNRAVEPRQLQQRFSATLATQLTTKYPWLHFWAAIDAIEPHSLKKQCTCCLSLWEVCSALLNLQIRELEETEYAHNSFGSFEFDLYSKAWIYRKPHRILGTNSNTLLLHPSRVLANHASISKSITYTE